MESLVKKILIIFIFVVLSSLSFVSCKLSQNIPVKPAVVTGIGGITAPPERLYTNSELEIGRRICSNLKKKREFFESLNSDKPLEFRFRAELRNCDNAVYNTDLFVAYISNASSIGPEYIANRDNYFRDVITDQSGALKVVCDSFIQSDKVSNTINNNNFKYFVNFMIADGFDRYEITKSQKNSSGDYEALSSEATSVIDSRSQINQKYLGVEKERIRYTACSNKNFQTQKQTWVEAVSTFQ